jgi:hypothetical protein
MILFVTFNAAKGLIYSGDIKIISAKFTKNLIRLLSDFVFLQEIIKARFWTDFLWHRIRPEFIFTNLTKPKGRGYRRMLYNWSVLETLIAAIK